MSLYDFNPGAYESAFQNGQKRDDQRRQQLAQALESIPQGIGSIAQYAQQQKQNQQNKDQTARTNRVSDVNTGIAVQNAGGDPNAALDYINGAPNNTQPSQPNQSGQDQSAQPYTPTFQPQSSLFSKGMGPVATLPDNAQTAQPYSPSVTPQSSQFPSGVGNVGTSPSPVTAAHIQSTGFNPDNHQIPGMPKSIFPSNQNADYGKIIESMAKGDYSGFQKLTPKQQSLVQADPRYKNMAKPEDVTPVDSVAAMLRLDPGHAATLKKQFPNGMTDKQIGVTSSGIKIDATTTEKQTQMDQKRWDTIVKDTDPYKASSRSALGVATLGNQRANRAIPVLKNPNATNQDISTAIADISGIFQGGVPTESGVHAQEYNTLASKLSNLKTLITGQPSAPAIPEVKQHLLDLIGQLKQVNNATLKDQLDYIEVAQPQLVQKNQAAWQGIRKKIGVDDTQPDGGNSGAATHRWNPRTGKVEVIQ